MITIDISSFIIGAIIGIILGLVLVFITLFGSDGIWSEGFTEGWDTGCEYGRKTKDTSKHLKEVKNETDN